MAYSRSAVPSLDFEPRVKIKVEAFLEWVRSKDRTPEDIRRSVLLVAKGVYSEFSLRPWRTGTPGAHIIAVRDKSLQEGECRVVQRIEKTSIPIYIFGESGPVELVEANIDEIYIVLFNTYVLSGKERFELVAEECLL